MIEYNIYQNAKPSRRKRCRLQRQPPFLLQCWRVASSAFLGALILRTVPTSVGIFSPVMMGAVVGSGVPAVCSPGGATVLCNVLHVPDRLRVDIVRPWLFSKRQMVGKRT